MQHLVTTMDMNKRRRTSPSSDGVALSDLPDEALSYVASFLACPSRALLAVAFRNTNSVTNAIISFEQWNNLDFGEIEKSLSSKITDTLVEEILVCIGANAKLRKLKLTGCVNITGSGLEPLRGSVVLEIIDLTLVAEHESPVLDPKPPILVSRFCRFLIASLREKTMR